MSELELEVVEEYKLLGEPRYRVRVKGTPVVINVHALSREEALEKARSIAEKIGVKVLLERGREKG